MLLAFRNVLVASVVLLAAGCVQTGKSMSVAPTGPSRLELADKCAAAIQKRLDPSPDKPKASGWVVSQDDPRASGNDFVLKYAVQNTTGVMGIRSNEILCIVRGDEIYDLQPVDPRQK
ncbi:hypothetical protein [Azospirillum sp. Sh1]|uniref:hypothetical protein n=1 Tax=Azospirillum sp. Sh1 TaxID=2607285 RepID=UPI0011EF2A04|nr:hypothetical protein [Azospirillum sp. Sh1]KAA0573484.1 hypothetical protein FZ029_21140 [Azospirillum sp. Sh1]